MTSMVRTSRNAVKLTQQVYEHIRAKLFAGEVGPGGRLSENKLADEFNVSRTPIRQAIAQLVREGYLDQQPKRGTFVRSWDRVNHAEFYEARLILETATVAKAATHATAQVIEQLEKAVAGMRHAVDGLRQASNETAQLSRLHDYARADTSFHLLIARAAANRPILQIITELLVKSNALLNVQIATESLFQTLAWDYRCHFKIFKAIKNRDPAAARARMLEHLEQARRTSLELFDVDASQRAMDDIPLSVWPHDSKTRDIPKLPARLLDRKLKP